MLKQGLTCAFWRKVVQVLVDFQVGLDVVANGVRSHCETSSVAR